MNNSPKKIPIAVAKEIAEKYNYDQIVIYARQVTEDEKPGGEHMTTYGKSKIHCDVAARMAATLQKFMGWNT